MLNEAVVALVCYSIRLQREDLQKFKNLKAIIRIGNGFDQFDLTAATELGTLKVTPWVIRYLGVAICHTPVPCIEERVDSALSLILNLYRKTFWTASSVSANNCPQGIEQLRELASGSRRIRGSRLLIVGLGQVGTAVALRAAVFGFQVSFYDPLVPEGTFAIIRLLALCLGIERTFGFTRFSALEEAIIEADCISFHCPLNAKTKRFVNMALLKKMKKQVFLVNINSDKLLVENDLMACLKNGQIGAAALDSYSFAPSNSFSTALAALPNVICTPRISWYSDASNKELRETASRQVRQVLLGDLKPYELPNCVNREALIASTKNSLPSQQPSTSSFLNQARQPTELFNSQTYQNLYMMNANNMLGQTPMSLYPQHLMSQLAAQTSLTNGNSNGRKGSVHLAMSLTFSNSRIKLQRRPTKLLVEFKPFWKHKHKRERNK